MKRKSKEKKVVREDLYTLKIIRYNDGSYDLQRQAENMDVLTLLGALSLTIGEIHQQIRGEFKPDIIKRTVIVDEKP